MMELQKYRIAFMGSSGFAVPVLHALFEADYDISLVITQPDRPQGRNREIAPTPVKIVAEQLGLQVYQPEKIRKNACLRTLEAAKPDVIVTASYGQIFTQKHLDIPPKGIVNVHASLLPELRGPAPIQFAIIQGKTVTGVTIMLTESGIDTGPIISSRSLNIMQSDTAGILENRLSHLGAQLLVETLPAYLSGSCNPTPQDHSRATHTRLLQKPDALISWSRSACDLANQIRGMNPCPGAFTSCGKMALKLHMALPYASIDSEEVPGTILDVIKNKGILIQTGQGVLLCEEVQPACRKRMSAETLIHGRYASIGDILGAEQVIGDSPCQE